MAASHLPGGFQLCDWPGTHGALQPAAGHQGPAPPAWHRARPALRGIRDHVFRLQGVRCLLRPADRGGRRAQRGDRLRRGCGGDRPVARGRRALAGLPRAVPGLACAAAAGGPGAEAAGEGRVRLCREAGLRRRRAGSAAGGGQRDLRAGVGEPVQLRAGRAGLRPRGQSASRGLSGGRGRRRHQPRGRGRRRRGTAHERAERHPDGVWLQHDGHRLCRKGRLDR